MAKSLKGKAKKKNNRAKRDLYNRREIAQLKRTLGLNKDTQRIRREEILKDLREIAAGIEALEKNGGVLPMNPDYTQVVIDVDAPSANGSPSTSSTRIINGHPEWKSQRKIKTAKKNAKKNAKKAPSKNKKEKKITKKRVAKKQKAE